MNSTAHARLRRGAAQLRLMSARCSISRGMSHMLALNHEAWRAAERQSLLRLRGSPGNRKP
jgi:hypothetical protein